MKYFAGFLLLFTSLIFQTSCFKKVRQCPPIVEDSIAFPSAPRAINPYKHGDSVRFKFSDGLVYLFVANLDSGYGSGFYTNSYDCPVDFSDQFLTTELKLNGSSPYVRNLSIMMLQNIGR